MWVYPNCVVGTVKVIGNQFHHESAAPRMSFTIMLRRFQHFAVVTKQRSKIAGFGSGMFCCVGSRGILEAMPYLFIAGETKRLEPAAEKT